MKDNLEDGQKRNDIRVSISAEEMAALFDPSLKIKEVKLVTIEEYDNRIEICSGCPALLHGSTCQHCGCKVQLKAKLRASKCPFPSAPRWPPIAARETTLPKQ